MSVLRTNEYIALFLCVCNDVIYMFVLMLCTFVLFACIKLLRMHALPGQAPMNMAKLVFNAIRPAYALKVNVVGVMRCGICHN